MNIKKTLFEHKDKIVPIGLLAGALSSFGIIPMEEEVMGLVKGKWIVVALVALALYTFFTCYTKTKKRRIEMPPPPRGYPPREPIPSDVAPRQFQQRPPQKPRGPDVFEQFNQLGNPKKYENIEDSGDISSGPETEENR